MRTTEAQQFVRDERYRLIAIAIKAGGFNYFSEIFTGIPKSVVCRDLGWNYMTFAGQVIHPRRLTCNDIYRMANLIQVQPHEVYDLINKELEAKGGYLPNGRCGSKRARKSKH
jgi:hypothetical protein